MGLDYGRALWRIDRQIDGARIIKTHHYSISRGFDTPLLLFLVDRADGVACEGASACRSVVFVYFVSMRHCIICATYTNHATAHNMLQASVLVLVLVLVLASFSKAPTDRANTVPKA